MLLLPFVICEISKFPFSQFTSREWPDHQGNGCHPWEKKEKKFPPMGIFQDLPAESPEAARPDPRAGPALGTGLDQRPFPPKGFH